MLVLCYNEPLALKLDAVMQAKGLAGRVVVRNFHKWCRQQLVAFGQSLPPQGDGFYDGLVERVIRGVERGQIPCGQYRALLIDEGHDFRPAWLKLVVQMVDPATNSLLLLYDDAQSIYERRRTRQFSFKSLGIQAQGRTTVLSINYRNTRQVLTTAKLVAADLLKPQQPGEDEIPVVQPLSCGREGREPLIIELPTLRDEARRVTELLTQAHEQGTPWRDMAIVCRRYAVMDACAAALRRRGLPHQVRKSASRYDPGADTITVMSMHASKGLEFPLVALPGIGQLPESGESIEDEARLFYVAATRATESLIITMSGRGAFARRLLPGTGSAADA